MLRRLFTLLSALSLLLCVATVVLWVRGAWVNDIVGRVSPSGGWDIQSWHGHLMLHTSNDPGDSPPTKTSWWPRPVTTADTDSPAFQKNWWNRVGFVYLSETYPTRRRDEVWPRRTPLPAIEHHRYLRVPLWFVALLGAVLPASRLGRLLRWWKRHRLAHNLCPSCGYDLRASRDRCPECGTATAAKVA
jgi:Zn ribbon nucleic-acid-binding protein